MDVPGQPWIKRLRRYPVTDGRSCPLKVITSRGLEWRNHAVRAVNISMTGVGVESESPIEPGVILFQECIWGYKFGTLVWCKRWKAGFRAGIQFIRPNPREEKRLTEDLERFLSHRSIHPSERQVGVIVGRWTGSSKGETEP